MVNNEHEVVNTDESFASRKFIMILIGLALAFGGAILAAKIQGFEPSYPTLVGGIIGLVGLYVTGNVSEKFLGGKVNAMVKMAALTGNKKAIQTVEEIKKVEETKEEVTQ